MSYVIGWDAYYSGGKTFSNKVTLIKDLPATGMLVWMLHFKDGTRRIIAGNDRYFWQDNGSSDGIFAQTQELPADILLRYPNAIIIEGVLVSDTEYNATQTLAFSTKL